MNAYRTNRPGTTDATTSALLGLVTDCGPLTGRYLAGQDERARARSASKVDGGIFSSMRRNRSAQRRSPLLAPRRRLGAALVSLGYRLQGVGLAVAGAPAVAQG